MHTITRHWFARLRLNEVPDVGYSATSASPTPERFARWCAGAALLLAFAFTPPLDAQARTKNVVLIVTDGLRWQEVYRGAERALISRQPGGVSDTAQLRREFWREEVEQRRQTLLPFLWGTVASKGQLYGNRDAGSEANVVNPLKFSYPGYNELLTGAYDPRIDSNDYPPNPNETVFEWMAKQPGYRGRVGAVATWAAFRNIFNRDRAGVDVIDGWDPPFKGAAALDPKRATINEFYRHSIRMWPTNAFDAPMHLATKEYIKLKQPRLLFVGYGETDEWAHSGRYDLLLQSANRVDSLIADLWHTMQQIPQYRGSTTFIITTDHGRGTGADGWKDHGEEVVGAEQMWIAVMGPDTPALGMRTNTARVTQSQIAATIAALLGQEPRRFSEKAGAPITEVLSKR